MVHDRTCGGGRLLPGLSRAWWAGGHLYRGLGRFDAWRGVVSWREALTFLATVEQDRPISEVQYWGHGKWGEALVGEERLDASVLLATHPLHPLLQTLASRFVPDQRGLLWFRTCETAGATRGQDFMAGLADMLGARVAGHTHIIGVWQSGTRGVAPGQSPGWSATEGLRRGTAALPEEALVSGVRAPSTIHCLQPAPPDTTFG